MRPVLKKILGRVESELPKCPVCGEKMMLYRKACSVKCLSKPYYRRDRDKYLKWFKRLLSKNRCKILEYIERYRKKYVRYRCKWLGKVICKKCGKFGYRSLIDM